AREAWRRSIAAQLPQEGLEALASALLHRDPSVVTDGREVEDEVTPGGAWYISKFSPVAFALWHGEREWQDPADLRHAAIQILLEALPFVEWCMQPIDGIRAALLYEVNLALALRAEGAVDCVKSGTV